MARTCNVYTKDGETVEMILTKKKSIKYRCFICCDFSSRKAKDCAHKDFHLYPYRIGKNPHTGKDRSEAIKKYCTWCMAGERHQVKKCSCKYCSIYPYRIGAKK